MALVEQSGEVEHLESKRRRELRNRRQDLASDRWLLWTFPNKLGRQQDDGSNALCPSGWKACG